MIWLNSIYELQYYNQPAGVPCYCEIIVYPSDMTLQGWFSPNSGAFSFQVDVMSPDGLTVYEDASDYFEIYYFVNPINGYYYFNARLKSFSPQMCVKVCYILRMRVWIGSTIVFDKYTERYCQSSCCDLARDIDITQNDIGYGDPDDLVVLNPEMSLNVATASNSYPKITECGDPIITITSRFECYDNFTGEYYATPTNVLFGTASFSYYKFSNMRGRIVRRPRSLTREYSYNCRLQRVESQDVYQLQGFEYFPSWKMYEIEGQLLATETYVDGVRYEYNGGTPFSQPTKCAEIFRLDTVIQKCIIRQIFGCPQPCDNSLNFDGSNALFVIPASYKDGFFYDENGVVIGDYDDLLTYYRSQDGATGLSEITLGSPIACDSLIYAAFSVNSYGYLPTSFYYDTVSQAKRVYLQSGVASISDICAPFDGICAEPVIGAVTIEEQTCDAPVIGTISIEDMTGEVIPIDGYGDWSLEDSETSATVFNGYVTLSLRALNDTLVASDSPAEPLFIANSIIALIGVTGRPTADVVLTNSNSSLPADTTVIIKTNGWIIYNGYAYTTNPSGTVVLFTDIHYNLTQ